MRMFPLLFLLEMLQKYKLLPRVIILTLLLKLAKPLSRLSSCCISPLQFPIYWAKPSIPYSPMKEHPDIVKFCHFSAYVRTRSAGILRGLAPWHTDFGTKSSVLHLVRGVQAPGTHVRSDYPQTRHIGGRPSSHKANLIPQSKRQDTTVMVIPCLCSFLLTVPSSAFSELPVNKKRTRTLSRKESGSSTNCMVDGTGLEPVTSCTSSRCSTS